MNSKIILLGILLVGLVIAGCVQNGATPTATATTTPTATPSPTGGVQTSGQGRAVFAVTDAAADMGAVTSVQATVEQVQVHSAAKGWVSVSTQPKTYDLLELKAQEKSELLADVNLAAGTYDQMRLQISQVLVTDANGTHQAKLPSNELKFAGQLEVKANQTSTATFDFIADESLHVTGNAESSGQARYIMAPVVQVQTRTDASVSVDASNAVRISGGSVKTNVEIGMDEKGNVGIGVKIPANANLSIDINGLIGIGSGGGLGIGAGGIVGVGGSGSANTDASGSAQGSANAGAQASGDAGASGILGVG